MEVARLESLCYVIPSSGVTIPPTSEYFDPGINGFLRTRLRYSITNNKDSTLVSGVYIRYVYGFDARYDYDKKK